MAHSMRVQLSYMSRPEVTDHIQQFHASQLFLCLWSSEH